MQCNPFSVTHKEELKGNLKSQFDNYPRHKGNIQAGGDIRLRRHFISDQKTEVKNGESGEVTPRVRQFLLIFSLVLWF
jgi:hypothetical protein